MDNNYTFSFETLAQFGETFAIRGNQEAEVAHFDEALGQDMLEEALQESFY